jgi:hypothetical protein
MHFSVRALLVCLAALPLGASTVDVSRESTITLHTGDSLVFSISASSFMRYANGAAPGKVSFGFSSAPFAGTWDFTAGLESPSTGETAPFSALQYSDGQFHGALYNGAVDTVRGSMTLGSGVVERVFSGPVVLLALQNTGGDVALGLSTYKLADDLTVSFSGSGIAVGGVVSRAVTLREAPVILTQRMGFEFAADTGGGSVDTPEPHTGLLAAGAALAFLGGALRRRVRAAR